MFRGLGLIRCATCADRSGELHASIDQVALRSLNQPCGVLGAAAIRTPKGEEYRPG